MYPLPSLTPPQEQVLALISAGSTISEAAHSAGVHRNTVHNWFHSAPAFRLALSRARDAKAIFWREQAEQLAAAAIDTVRAIMTEASMPAAVRLKAAQSILALAMAPPPEPPSSSLLDFLPHPIQAEAVKSAATHPSATLPASPTPATVPNSAQRLAPRPPAPEPPAATPPASPTPATVHNSAQRLAPRPPAPEPPAATPPASPAPPTVPNSAQRVAPRPPASEPPAATPPASPTPPTVPNSAQRVPPRPPASEPSAATPAPPPPGAPAPVRRASPKVGRNEPCPCGSGRKFKRCCLEQGAAGVPAGLRAAAA